ncbi:leucine-rich repeats and IQ motif containing 4 [Cricetulus griseus]
MVYRGFHKHGDAEEPPGHLPHTLRAKPQALNRHTLLTKPGGPSVFKGAQSFPLYLGLLQHFRVGTKELGVKTMSKEVLKPELKVLQRNDPHQVTDRTFFMDGSNQNLKTIPSEILALKELEELHLENNQISEIDPDIQHLKNVRVLYLHKNNLQFLCQELASLSSLESLDVSSNPLLYSSLPVLSCLRTLRELRLYDTGLREVPTVICKSLHHLQLFGLSGNHLESLPKEIVNQTKLREIYLKKNQFFVFPPDLCVLVNLEVIDMDYNKLKAIPEEIGNLVKLQKFYLLYMRNTSLRGLRRSFKRLVNLRFLDLSQNHIDHFPAQICALKNLEILALDDNKVGQRNCPCMGAGMRFGNAHHGLVEHLNNGRPCQWGKRRYAAGSSSNAIDTAICARRTDCCTEDTREVQTEAKDLDPPQR